MGGRVRILLGLAGLSGFVAVAAGALSQHGVADPTARDWLKTGAQYGLVDALGVFASYVLIRDGSRIAEAAAWLFLAGGVLFAWTLDLMAVSGQSRLAAFVPIGGLLMMAAWLSLAVAGVRAARKLPS